MMMAVRNIRLDLSDEELSTLIRAVGEEVYVKGRLAELRHATDAERELLRRDQRCLLIALRQMEAAAVESHDGGPVGTCRYSLR